VAGVAGLVGLLAPGDLDGGRAQQVGVSELDAARVAELLPGADPDHAGGSDAWPAPTDPLAVARHLVKVAGLRDDGGVLTTRWWRGGFYAWTGTHWNAAADPAVRARLYRLLEHARHWRTNKDGTPELVAWAPTRRKVGDVLEALQAVVYLDEWTEPPAWVDGDGSGRLLALRNGLLHLPTRRLQAHSPRLFNLLSLPYDYDPTPPHPSRPAGWSSSRSCGRTTPPPSTCCRSGSGTC
jgi:hypothetical protein